MSISHFYEIVYKVMDIVIGLPELALKFPKTEAEWKKSAYDFSKVSRMYTRHAEIRISYDYSTFDSTNQVITGCVTCIDGWCCFTTVPSKKECTDSAGLHSSHYQHYGINVQAACDHLCRF